MLETPLLLQAHGRNFLELKFYHGSGILTVMSLGLCRPGVLSTAVREDTQTPLRAAIRAV